MLDIPERMSLIEIKFSRKNEKFFLYQSRVSWTLLIKLLGFPKLWIDSVVISALSPLRKMPTPLAILCHCTWLTAQLLLLQQKSGS